MKRNLPATKEHTSWSQNHPIQNNFQRAERRSNSLHRRCFNFYLNKNDCRELEQRTAKKKMETSKMEVYLFFGGRYRYNMVRGMEHAKMVQIRVLKPDG